MPLKKGTTTIGAIYKGTTPIARVYKGTTLVFESGLPKEYTELKYIESTGTQYIDSGFVPNQNTSIIGKARYVSYIQGTQLIGARMGTQSANRLMCFAIYRNDSLRNVVGTLDYTFSYTFNTDFTFIFNDNNNCYLNGTLVSTLDWSYFSIAQNNTLYLFAISGYSPDIWGSNSRIYYCKIYDNGTLVRNFVPCYRNSDGEVGLYDKVNGIFYTNAGTGTFVKGPVAKLPTAYQEVEYIASSGTQYMDSQYIPNANTKIIFDTEMGYTNAGTRQGRHGDGERLSIYSVKTTQQTFTEFAIGSYTQINNLDTVGTRHIFELDVPNLVGKLDGVVEATFTSISWTNQQTIYFFGRHTATQPDGLGPIKNYNIRVFENNIIVRNFIPCYRLADNEIGLYDLVNGVFYTNEGTGTFTKGSDIL